MAENHLGSRWAPRGPVAVQEDGFATRASTSYTSSARRSGESAVLVQKSRKPAVFLYGYLEAILTHLEGILDHLDAILRRS